MPRTCSHCVIGQGIGAMPRLQVLVASAGRGASGAMNHYAEELGAAAAVRQSILRELWVCGSLPPVFFWRGSEDPLLSLLDVFDSHPHLRFVHVNCCPSAAMLQPAGRIPELVPFPHDRPVTDGSGRRIHRLAGIASGAVHYRAAVHYRFARDV